MCHSCAFACANCSCVVPARVQASVESLRSEVRAALAAVRHEWEVAVDTAAVRHAEQMAEGKAREDRLKGMR
jgi:hypothetical protein